MTKYKSDLSHTIHKMATSLHKAGAITDEVMESFNKSCLVNHKGSSFDSFLEEEGILEEVTDAATKRIDDVKPVEMFFSYPFNVTQEGDEFIVTFPDVPEALTSANTEADAVALAEDALIAALGGYVDGRQNLPAPTDTGDYLVHLPPMVSAKLALYKSINDAADVEGLEAVREFDFPALSAPADRAEIMAAVRDLNADVRHFQSAIYSPRTVRTSAQEKHAAIISMAEKEGV